MPEAIGSRLYGMGGARDAEVAPRRTINLRQNSRAWRTEKVPALNKYKVQQGRLLSFGSLRSRYARRAKTRTAGAWSRTPCIDYHALRSI